MPYLYVQSPRYRRAQSMRPEFAPPVDSRAIRDEGLFILAGFTQTRPWNFTAPCTVLNTTVDDKYGSPELYVNTTVKILSSADESRISRGSCV
eukprot:1247980-Heterocapsa_arctica.AAC.1